MTQSAPASIAAPLQTPIHLHQLVTWREESTGVWGVLTFADDRVAPEEVSAAVAPAGLVEHGRREPVPLAGAAAVKLRHTQGGVGSAVLATGRYMLSIAGTGCRQTAAHAGW